MVYIYVRLVNLKLKKIEDVPLVIREEVKKALKENRDGVEG